MSLHTIRQSAVLILVVHTLAADTTNTGGTPTLPLTSASYYGQSGDEERERKREGREGERTFSGSYRDSVFHGQPLKCVFFLHRMHKKLPRPPTHNNGGGGVFYGAVGALKTGHESRAVFFHLYSQSRGGSHSSSAILQRVLASR